MFESWSVSHGDVAVYTENPDVAKLLRELVGRGTTYERAGRVFAWQFILPKQKQLFVERKISGKFDIDSQRVTGMGNTESAYTDIQKVKVED